MPDHDSRFQLGFTADRGDARLRLDQALVRRVGREVKLSRTLARRWIEAGLVQIGDRTARRASQPVAEGARVVVALPAGVVRRAAPVPEELKLDVVYEDDHLLVINKPPGVVVHPTYKHASSTILNGVLWRLRGRSGAAPGVVTRLDKDTSGLVLVALSPDVHARVQADARAGRVRKHYLAVVEGVPHPAAGTLEMPLGRDVRDRRRIVVRSDGAPSETRYQVLSHDDRRALVACELLSGRTHQIRVHLATSGWPIVGDRTYGAPDPAVSRQALHAWRLELPHPVTLKALQLEAPLPLDLQLLAGNPDR
jgi:23S rRNA pseudouridine1911/1915/1917 synthase